MSKKFEHTNGKDASNKKIDVYAHKGDGHNLEITYFTENHYDDEGGALIDVEINEACVEAKVSLYLDRKECLELAKILNKHAKGKKRC